MQLLSEITESSPGDDTTNHDCQRMLQMITGYWVTQIVHAVANFCIADELAKGPATAADIASRRSTHPHATFRLLRACVSIGLVTFDAQSRFVGTQLLDTLRSDAPGSLRGMAISQAGAGHWLPWGNFCQAMATGERQTIATLGDEIFDYYVRTPAEAEAFTNAMTGRTAEVAREAVRLIDTRSAAVAADIGGAAGALIHALMQANPDLRGIVLDLPNVVPSAIAAAEKAGLQRRLSVVAGDFFDSVPEADLYILKFILHDWDDAECIRILKNCRRAMCLGGRVAVIERHLGESNEPGFTPLVDLNMMVMVTGRERTTSEYGDLLAAADLRLASVTPTRSGMCIMEAVPV
jgi:hypothetical protein